jgi:hypothetical protein
MREELPRTHMRRSPHCQPHCHAVNASQRLLDPVPVPSSLFIYKPAELWSRGNAGCRYGADGRVSRSLQYIVCCVQRSAWYLIRRAPHITCSAQTCSFVVELGIQNILLILKVSGSGRGGVGIEEFRLATAAGTSRPRAATMSNSKTVMCNKTFGLFLGPSSASALVQ